MRVTIKRFSTWFGTQSVNRQAVMIVVAVLAVLLGILIVIPGADHKKTATVFPPKTLDQARSLGDSAKHPAHVVLREGLSFPPCECRLNALVPRGLSARQTAAALLQVFFDNNLDGQLDDYGADGGVVVFGYYTRSEVGQGFTAGRVELRVTNGQHTMTIDTGGLYGKQYSFTY